MSDEIFEVATHSVDVAALGQDYSDRVDGERILLALPREIEVGEEVRFVVLLVDGTPAFAGAGRCIQVSDQGPVAGVSRFETLLDSLAFDERSAPVYEYIVAVRQLAYQQANYETEVSSADPREAFAAVEADVEVAMGISDLPASPDGDAAESAPAYEAASHLHEAEAATDSAYEARSVEVSTYDVEASAGDAAPTAASAQHYDAGAALAASAYDSEADAQSAYAAESAAAAYEDEAAAGVHTHEAEHVVSGYAADPAATAYEGESAASAYAGESSAGAYEGESAESGASAYEGERGASAYEGERGASAYEDASNAERGYAAAAEAEESESVEVGVYSQAGSGAAYAAYGQQEPSGSLGEAEAMAADAAASVSVGLEDDRAHLGAGDAAQQVELDAPVSRRPTPAPEGPSLAMEPPMAVPSARPEMAHASDEGLDFAGGPRGAQGQEGAAQAERVYTSVAPEPLRTGILTRPAIAAHWAPAAPRPPQRSLRPTGFQAHMGPLAVPDVPPRPALDRSQWVERAPAPV